MFPRDIEIKKIEKFEDGRGFLEVRFEGQGNDSIALKKSFSKKGVFRGMHFQQSPNSQKKIIQVISGSVIDFVIDMRSWCSSFGKIYHQTINAMERESFVIPDYYAHGFLALEDTCLQYLTLGKYCSESEICLVLPDDYLNNLGINFNNLILSEKDKKGFNFENYFKS